MPFSKNQYLDFCHILGIPLIYKLSQSYVQFVETSNQEITLTRVPYFDNKPITVNY